MYQEKREVGRSDKCLAWGRLQFGRLPHIFLIVFNGPDILGSLTYYCGIKREKCGRQKVGGVKKIGGGRGLGCQASNS